MKRGLVKVSITVLIVVMFLSCSSNLSISGSNRIRISLSAEAGELLDAVVYEEGKDGNAVSGSLVQVIDPGFSTTLLLFSTVKSAYTGSPPALDGRYKVIVNSIAYGVTTNGVIYHPLLQKPSIVDISDSSGASAMTGALLSRSKAIVVSWLLVTNATVYQVRAVQSGSLVFQGTTSNTTYTIPTNSLSAGSTTVTIRAQYIGGDALFALTNWYALSWCDGDSVFVTVQ